MDVVGPFFLDTNILLDYLENRDQEIVYLLNRSRRSNVTLITSSINLVEVFDKEQEIYFIGKLVLKRLSFDEILRQKRNRHLEEHEKREIASKINRFLEEFKIKVYALDESGYSLAFQLMQDLDLNSQDALILSVFLLSDAKYFLTKDKELAKQGELSEGLKKRNKKVLDLRLKENIDRLIKEISGD